MYKKKDNNLQKYNIICIVTVLSRASDTALRQNIFRKSIPSGNGYLGLKK